MANTGGAARIGLDVPYGEKDEAKRHGARWDPQARRWYAPRPGMDALTRWAALPEVPDLLPGEDRSFGEGLFVDLIPETCWFTNVRSCVVPRDWERIRRMVIRRAGKRCEVCGSGEDRSRQPRSRWLEVHERWAYDQSHLVQTLKRLICLCTDCHTTTHYGLAQLRGLEAEALAHLRVVTHMSELEAKAHVSSAFKLWRQRSQHVWTLDIAMLTDAGMTVTAPPTADSRAAVARVTTNSFRSPSVDQDQAEALEAEAVELVRMMRGTSVPVDETSPIKVRVRGHEVEVDPRRL